MKEQNVKSLIIRKNKKIKYKSRSFLKELKRIDENYKLRKKRSDGDRKRRLDRYD